MDPRADGGRAGASPVRYFLAAGTATLAYLGVLKALLAVSVPYMLAILGAQMIIIPCAFVAYRSLVFGPGTKIWTDFLRFLTVWVGGAIAGLVTTPVLVEFAGMDPFVAQVLTIVAVAVGSFVSHVRFSFRGHPH